VPVDIYLAIHLIGERQYFTQWWSFLELMLYLFLSFALTMG